MQILMKHLTIGLFHDDDLGHELGKKGTESDILMYNRKTDDCVYSFMQPFEDKLTPKTQIISTIDAAIVSCKEITPEIGETILILDSVGISNGLIVVPEFSDTTQISALIKDTTLKDFSIVERNIIKIMETLEGINPDRDNSSPPAVIVDHSFSVKGVGEVILGLVKQGTIHKHDKMRLLPLDKEIVVRSIQMQDKDFDEAIAGCRVGLAIKGAIASEMRRGSIFTNQDGAKIGKDFKLKIKKNRFYPEIKTGVFHATVGMQSIPVNINEINGDIIDITTEKPICYTDDDNFIILDLNAKKLRHIGNGRIV